MNWGVYIRAERARRELPKGQELPGGGVWHWLRYWSPLARVWRRLRRWR